ncbi:MAG: META domain-containing protein [Bacteroidota bacterium]
MSCSYRLPHFPMLVSISLLAYLIFSCTESDLSRSLNGTWQYAFHENVENGEIVAEPDYIARPVVITFDDNGKKGDFYGQTVTNAIQGKYRLESERTISFTEIVGGQRGEPDWAADFWDALNSAENYNMENERLEILYDDGNKKLIFIPEE